MHQQFRTETEPGKGNCSHKTPYSIPHNSFPSLSISKAENGQPHAQGRQSFMFCYRETSQTFSQKITVLYFNRLPLSQLNHETKHFSFSCMQNHMICLDYPHVLINILLFVCLKASGPVPLDRNRRYHWLQLGGVNPARHFLYTTNLSTS